MSLKPGFLAPLRDDRTLFFLQVTQRETKISIMTIAANTTIPTITPINMEKLMHNPPRPLDELISPVMLSLGLIVPKGIYVMKHTHVTQKNPGLTNSDVQIL